MKRSKILIHNFYDYCGGGLALSELCRSLRELGYDARLIVTKINPLNQAGSSYLNRIWKKDNLWTLFHIMLCKCLPLKRLRDKYDYSSYCPLHIRGQRRQWLPFINKERDIVIYPETVYGNPFEAKNVVRWLLYYYQHFDDPNAYSQSDLFLGYKEVFNDRQHTPDIENVLINCFDSSLYCRTNFGKRSGKCYIVRKGSGRSDLPDKFDGIVVDDMPEAEIVGIFNECEYCYSYDTHTFYSSIAAICGCKSIVLPEPGKSKDDYLNPTDPSYGVAWGDDEKEIARAVNSVDKLVEQIEKMKKNNLIEIGKLVNVLERYFNVKVARRFMH